MIGPLVWQKHSARVFLEHRHRVIIVSIATSTVTLHRTSLPLPFSLTRFTVILGRVPRRKPRLWGRRFVLIGQVCILLLHGMLHCVEHQVSVEVAEINIFLENKLEGVDSVVPFDTSNIQGALAFRATNGGRVDQEVEFKGHSFSVIADKVVSGSDPDPLLFRLTFHEVLRGQHQSECIDVAPVKRHLDYVSRPSQARFNAWLRAFWVLLHELRHAFVNFVQDTCQVLV